MRDLKINIRNEVREKSKDMDEGNLKEWIDSIFLEIETLEIKCEEVHLILRERSRNIIKHIKY